MKNDYDYDFWKMILIGLKWLWFLENDYDWTKMIMIELKWLWLETKKWLWLWFLKNDYDWAIMILIELKWFWFLIMIMIEHTGFGPLSNLYMNTYNRKN